MFCEQCGKNISDAAKFCSECGNKVVSVYDNVENNEDKINVNIKDSYDYEKAIDNNYEGDTYNEILLEVRPKYKFTYLTGFDLLKEIGAYLIFFMMYIIFLRIEIYSEDFFIIIIPSIIAFVIFIVIRLAIAFVKSSYKKQQYKNHIYIFYKDRVVFIDSFLNSSEKELKYKDIREVSKKQRYMQKLFNIGNIRLYSNIEDDYLNDIYMNDIEYVDDVYLQIKDIIKNENVN